jgi:hypothetical protein
MKHEFSEKTRDIQDQQTVVLTAIESQTKIIVSTMSIVQETVTSMDGEIRDLRKDLEALGHISAVSGATCMQNNTQEHGKDFENGNRCLEVVKSYQHNGNTAYNFQSTEADFIASSTAHDTHIQGSSGNHEGSSVSTMCYSPGRDCRLETVEPSLGFDTDAGALNIMDRRNTADFERNIPETDLVCREVTADDDMPDIFIDPTFFAAPNSVITVSTTLDTWRRRRTEYQNGSESIASPSGQLTRNRVGNRRPPASHPRPRLSIQGKRIDPKRSKAGHLGGRQTAKSMKEAAIVRKKLDLWSRKRRDMKLSDHAKAQTPEWSSHGCVSSDEEDAPSVDKSGSLIRDLEPDSTSNLGDHDHFNSPASDVFSVQSLHGGDISSSIATRPKDDHESLDSLKASEDFASAAVAQIGESQEDSRNHTSSGAPEASARSLVSASELVKPDHDENGETLTEDNHQYQMTPRSNECGHHSDIADPRDVHSFDAVTSGAQGSQQSDHRTSDWTKNPESDLEIAPVTNLPQSNGSSQGVTGDGHYDSLNVVPKGDQSVATPPLCPPVCHQDMTIVVVDTLPSSTVDGQNGSGMSGHIEKHIGVARDLTHVSENQPQLPTSILLPPDIVLPASPSGPIGALLSTENHRTRQQSSQQKTNSNVYFSKRRDEDESAASDHLLEDVRSDHAASSLLGEPRGQKRSGVMPDRFYKEKRPKLPDDDNPETTTTCPSENGRNESAVALFEPSARISGKEISASLQNNEPVTGATPGSSDIEMADSCTLLNQNLGSKSVNKTVIESDPEKSNKLGVATSEPATGRWKALIEQRRREREDGRRKTRPLREAMKRDQRKRESGHAAVSLEDTLFVPSYESSLQFEHGEPFEIDTKTGTSTNLEHRDKQRLPGSSSQGISVVGDESGVNIHESSPDQQHVVTSQIHSAATTGRPAAMAGHTNSQVDSIQPSSDEHDELQSVGPVNKEDVITTPLLPSSGMWSQNPLSGSSAANSVSSFAHEENTQQVLEPKSSTIVGHVVVFDGFSQTVPELESDDIA